MKRFNAMLKLILSTVLAVLGLLAALVMCWTYVAILAAIFMPSV